MRTNFWIELYSKEGAISSKRFFGSLILLIVTIYLGFVIFSDTSMNIYEYYCWTTAFVTSAVLVGGDTIKDIVVNIFNKLKKQSDGK